MPHSQDVTITVRRANPIVGQINSMDVTAAMEFLPGPDVGLCIEVDNKTYDTIARGSIAAISIGVKS